VCISGSLTWQDARGRCGRYLCTLRPVAHERFACILVSRAPMRLVTDYVPLHEDAGRYQAYCRARIYLPDDVRGGWLRAFPLW
jgi:hypothetical protein